MIYFVYTSVITLLGMILIITIIITINTNIYSEQKLKKKKNRLDFM